jgi:D-inositol-3-phosphate glycosyltransferase|tara:strand:+ start:146 stop:1288 length:1143 start_codon:yes stop_codon:yes gene_type:complete
MNILQISFHTAPMNSLGVNDGGGLNVYVEAVSKELAKDNTVHILTGEQAKNINKKNLKLNSFNLFSNQENIDEKKKFLDVFIEQAFQYVEEHEIDVIHAHYWLSGLVAKKIKEKYKIPFIFTSHSLGVFVQENNLDRISSEKEIFNAADKVTASSIFEKENLLNRYGVNKLKIHIVTPGLNKKTFKAYRGEKRNNIILSVGRIQKQKGQLQTLDLFKSLQYRIKGLELIFVGGPSGADGESYLNKMKNRIEELRIEEDVQFVGSLSQKKLVKLMRKSKLLIHSAENETFGLVAIEAHRLGVPVLSTNQGSFKELISNNENGLVAKSFDDVQVYNFIIKLFEEAEYRSQLINSSVKNSLEFNWEITAQNLKKAYKSLYIIR